MILNNIGIVIIGRNEGQRLIDCLTSVQSEAEYVVYVDSGSTDGSSEAAERLGATVVRLDMSQPFTAARGRNAGFAALKELKPDIRYVQFVDGDCELVLGWLNTAYAFLEERNDVAVVCGRRRERYPERSAYNRLCDIEWDTPVGEATACGGDALMRTAAFEAVGGFRAELMTGEEPELCLRLRQAGWKIWRIDAEMTRHDAAMMHFRQWWRRGVRSGQGDAVISWLYTPHGVSVREKRDVASAIVWAGVLPLFVGIGTLVHPAALAGVLLYPIQIIRIALRRGIASPESWNYALLMMILKFAQLQGNLKYCWHYWRGQSIQRIEYKQSH